MPAVVAASFRAVRSNSLVRKCASSSEILRLAVATGVLRRRAAAERLPTSATASTIDMPSRRSIADPFHGLEQWIPFLHPIHIFGKDLSHGRPQVRAEFNTAVSVTATISRRPICRKYEVILLLRLLCSR